MPNPNIAEAGKATRWKKGVGPPSPGRKPSKLKKYIKAVDFSSHDLELLLKNLFANNSIDELKSKLQDGKLPALVWGFVVAYIADVRKGASGGGFVSQMFERAFGKVKQEIEYSGGLAIDSMTPEERKEMIAGLIAKYNEQGKQDGSETDNRIERIESDTNKVHGDGTTALESASGISGGVEEVKQGESGEVKETDS